MCCESTGSAAQIKPCCVFVFMLVDWLIACVDSKCTHACLLWLCFLVVVPPLRPHSCFSFSVILLVRISKYRAKMCFRGSPQTEDGVFSVIVDVCPASCESLRRASGSFPCLFFLPSSLFAPSRVWCSLKWTFFPLPGTFSHVSLPR